MAIFKKKGSALPQQGGQVNSGSSKKKFWDTIEGRYVEDKFSKKTLSWVVSFAILVLLIILVNYLGMFKVRRLADLNRELTELKIEQMTISTELMNSQRLSTIEKRLEAEGIDIEVSKTSPIALHE